MARTKYVPPPATVSDYASYIAYVQEFMGKAASDPMAFAEVNYRMSEKTGYDRFVKYLSTRPQEWNPSRTFADLVSGASATEQWKKVSSGEKQTTGVAILETSDPNVVLEIRAVNKASRKIDDENEGDE